MSESDVLPPGWAEVTVGDLFEGLRPKVPADPSSLLPFIGMDHVESDTMRLLGSGRFSEMKSAGARFHPGDILYGRLRPYLNKVLHAAFEGVSSAEFLVFPQVPAVSNDFFKYILTNRFFVTFASHPDNVTGDRPRIDFDTISKYRLNLPPHPEQARIVSRIEELFSDLDKGEENLRRAQAQLKRYRQSVLKATVTGELTRSWRERNADTLESGEALRKRILKARREAWEKAELEKLRAKGKPPKDDAWKSRYMEPQGPNTEGLPESPQGWAWVNIEQVSIMIQYGSSAKTGDDSSGIPVLRMGNIRQDGGLLLDALKYLPNSHDEFPALLLKAGDLLFNRTNSAELVGKTGYYAGRPSPCSFASYLIRVRPVETVSSKFLSYCLNSALGRAWVKEVVNQTAGQANVNGTKLGAFTLPLPSQQEQDIIVQQVERLAVLIENLEGEMDAGMRRLKALRQSILKAAFSGMLVPQDPNDEPASELLKRIAAERAAQSARPARSAAQRTPSKPRKARVAAQPSVSSPAAPSAAVAYSSVPGLAAAPLVAARKAAGLSQAQLAERAGMNQAYVSQMETGKRAITADQAAALALALGIEPSALTQA